MIRILLDTEIGNNIDDAFALALACTSPEIDLLGVCTVGDDAAARSVLARRLLGSYGRTDVPVATGHLPPNSFPPVPAGFTQRHYAQAEGPMSPCVHGPMEQFAAATLAEHSKVTLVTTGPLTNIAAILRAYPAIEQFIERLVFMGGWPSQGLPESNIGQDPEAARTVFAARFPVIMIGYEVTRGCALRQQHLQHLEASSSTGPRFLHALWRAWERACHARHAVMHDPLTVAFLCRPELMEFRNMRVQVRPQTDTSRGLVYSDNAGGREVTVATDLLAEAYLNMLLERVAPDREPPWQSHDHRDPLRWGVVLKQAYQSRHFPGWRSGAQYFTDHVLALVMDGGCTVSTQGDSFQADAGSVLYFNCDQEYSIQSEEGMEAYWFHFLVYQQGVGGGHLRIPKLPELPAHSVAADQKLQMLVSQAERLAAHWQNPGPDSGFVCQAALLEMLGSLFALRYESEAMGRSHGEVAVIHAKRFVEAQFHRELSLEEIARHVSLSPYHLAKLFKRFTGVTPMQYQLQLRMHQAKRLLRSQLLSIKAVAAQVGYNSAPSFSRAFKREVGVAPNEFRD